MASAPGLRERKKQQTRERIIAEALRLFEARGFDATTVAEISEAADISPRTFFGYFKAKDDVVFHDHEETLASFTAHLRSRGDGQSVFDALRAWCMDLEEDGHFEADEHRRRSLLIRRTPSLAAREHAHLAEFEQLLAAEVATDLGVERDSLRAHLVGAAAMAALVALGRWDEENAQAERPAVEILDEALVFLQGGLDALRRHPA